MPCCWVRTTSSLQLPVVASLLEMRSRVRHSRYKPPTHCHCSRLNTGLPGLQFAQTHPLFVHKWQSTRSMLIIITVLVIRHMCVFVRTSVIALFTFRWLHRQAPAAAMATPRLTYRSFTALVVDQTEIEAVCWLPIWSSKKSVLPAWEVEHCRMLGVQAGAVNVQSI